MIIRQPGDLPAYRPWERDERLDRSMNTVCTYVRILNHLGKIVEGLDERESLPTADSGDQFTPHISTYLKLLLTMSYARNATLKIGPKFTEKLYFLDILSASGLTYPGGATQPLPGSCFAVPLAYQEFSRPRTPPSASFSKSWAFELDSKRIASLKQRHEKLRTNAGFVLPPLSAIQGDANESLLPVLEQLAQERRKDLSKKKTASLSLVFVDNIGLNVKMATIEAIQKSIRADLVIHLPLRAIWRSITQFRAGSSGANALDEFFGNKEWMQVKNMAEIPAAYHDSVQSLTPQAFQEFEPVQIRSTNQEFALCVFARRTKGMTNKSPGWVASIRALAAACNDFSPKTLERVLNVASGKQTTL